MQHTQGEEGSCQKVDKGKSESALTELEEQKSCYTVLSNTPWQELANEAGVRRLSLCILACSHVVLTPGWNISWRRYILKKYRLKVRSQVENVIKAVTQAM